MAERVIVRQSYDSDIAAFVVDTNCDKLVKSMDPVSVAPKLVSRRLISSQQAQDILEDRVKTRAERNLAFLNLIKSSPDPMWFSSLLQAFGEETMTEGLKEALEEGYRAVICDSSNVNWAASSRKRVISTSQPPAKLSRLCHVWHPLENEFERVKSTFLKVLEEKQRPSLKALKEYCCDRVASVETMQPCVAEELEDAPSYEAVVRILFTKVCKWLSFSLLEMILDYDSFRDPLCEVKVQLKKYKKRLRGELKRKFDSAEETLKAKVTENIPPDGMKKIVVRYNLDAGGITLEDVARYRQFLSSIVKIPHHLLVLISVLYGSLLLELWIPEELTPQVVRKVEEVWRELWRRKVESIDVGDRSFDLLQQSNKEKAALIGESLSVFGAEQWKNVLLPWGTRLYEEYGRHESLQSCVKKHREAGHPSPEALGALEWLLLHHTPEVVEKEGKDLLNVLLTTVYLGCCNMEAFVSTVVVCLEGDPAMGIRLQEASTELRLAFGYTSLYVQEEVVAQLITWLPDEAVTKLYLKYRHLPSLQDSISPGGKDPHHLSHEEAERVKKWFQGHMTKLQERRVSYHPSPYLSLALVEAGVTDEELGPCPSHMTRDVASLRTSLLSKMEKRFPHSQEDVRAIRDSFQVYLASISPDALLQAANTQRRDIFQLLFEELEEQKAGQKSYLRGKVPLDYQQDLEHAFIPSAVPVAMETSTTPKEKQVPGPTLGSVTGSSSRDSSHSSHPEEALKGQKAGLWQHKSHLRKKVPPYYQQDLEQAFTSSTGAVAMETSTTPKEKPVSGPTLVSVTGSSSVDSSHSSHLAEEVNRQFEVQSREVFLMLSSASKREAFSEELACTPLFVSQNSSARLLSAEDSSAIAREPPLKLSSWYEVSFLKLASGVLLGSMASINQFVRSRDDSLQHTSLPECFPQGPLMANQLAPPPGYTPLRLTLPSHPEDVPMGRLWSLKEHLCSSLALQPYALLLKGYMEGSTHIIFHISQHVTLGEDRVAAMFVGAKRAGLYPHSITTALGTAQEVEHRLMDMLPLIKMRRVRGQMEGLTVTEREREHQACFKA